MIALKEVLNENYRDLILKISEKIQTENEKRSICLLRDRRLVSGGANEVVFYNRD